MHLVYNGVPLALEHTADLTVRSVYDEPSGLDLLWQEVDVSVVCVFNPMAVATSKLAGPDGRLTGDALGVTLFNLRQTLMVPQKQLSLTLGPDRAFLAPRNDAGNNPLPCDPMGGPFPQELKVLSITGDKTAVVLYRIRFAVSDCQKFVLSNRWRVTSQTDAETHLTTRVVEGRARLRLDFLNFQVPAAMADQFRAAFVMAEPPGFIRKSVDVVATEDGSELVYRVVDRQVRLNLGSQSAALKVEGNATAGVDTPVKDIKALVSAFSGPFGSLVSGHPFDAALAAMSSVWHNLVPVAKANVIARVFGDPAAKLEDLANIAVNIALDRFGTLAIGNTVFPVSAYLTQDMGSENGTFVELRMEFLPANANALMALLNPANVAGMMNLNQDIANGGFMGPASLKQDPGWGNPRLPASNGTRGTWVAFLVTQALTQGCSPPGSVPPPVDTLTPPRKEFPNVV